MAGDLRMSIVPPVFYVGLCLTWDTIFLIHVLSVSISPPNVGGPFTCLAFCLRFPRTEFIFFMVLLNLNTHTKSGVRNKNGFYRDFLKFCIF